MNLRDLLSFISSPAFDEERKAILTRINRNITTIMAEYSRADAKMMNKIAERKKKALENSVKERQMNDKTWNDCEQRMAIVLSKSIEKFRVFMVGIPPH
jgi:hypothetical protein